MGLIQDEVLKEILEHYPKEQHKLLTVQIKRMESLIEENKDRYTNDLSFRTAFDLMLNEMIMGSFILKGENNEN